MEFLNNENQLCMPRLSRLNITHLLCFYKLEIPHILARSSVLGVSQAGNHSVVQGSHKTDDIKMVTKVIPDMAPLCKSSTGKESANLIHMAAGKIQFLEGC